VTRAWETARRSRDERGIRRRGARAGTGGGCAGLQRRRATVQGCGGGLQGLGYQDGGVAVSVKAPSSNMAVVWPCRAGRLRRADWGEVYGIGSGSD
jgi:hypothetical protein